MIHSTEKEIVQSKNCFCSIPSIDTVCVCVCVCKYVHRIHRSRRCVHTDVPAGANPGGCLGAWGSQDSLEVNSSSFTDEETEARKLTDLVNHRQGTERARVWTTVSESWICPLFSVSHCLWGQRFKSFTGQVSGAPAREELSLWSRASLSAENGKPL